MPSTGERKRSHDGSIMASASASATADEPSPSPRRIRKLRKPSSSSFPDPPDDLPRRELSLLDLPALVLAQVGRYLHVEQTDGQKALTALGVVLGSQTASVLRHEYLRNNLDYLTHLHGRIKKLKSKVGKKEIAHADLRKTMFLLKAVLEDWMQCNSWWKDACLKAFGTDGSRTRSYADIPCFRTYEFKVDSDYKGWRAGSLYRQLSARNMAMRLNRFPDQAPFLVVAEINGSRCRGMSLGEFRSLLGSLEGADKTFWMIHEGFAEIFANPCLMTDLGHFDLLKFQIKELGIDTNKGRGGGILDKSIETPAHARNFLGREKFVVRGKSLLYHAFFQPDDRFLTFVLFQTNYVSNSSSFKNLFHQLPVLLAGNWRRQQNLDKIELLLQAKGQAKDFDLNSPDEHGQSPLDIVCHTFRRAGTAETIDFMYRLAKVYLSHGAKVTEKALEEMKGHRRMLDLLEAYK